MAEKRRFTKSTCLGGERMTRIDCRVAAECGLEPTEYVGQFIHLDGD
jgi:hypothetical protein